ncbi:MAG: hypothetical protein Q7S11_02215 [bacterium]|nr:hypothetical protein [bacterium]
MPIVKGTEVILRSFQERLKNVLENEQRPEEEGKQPIANLLFQFIRNLTGYLDIEVAYIDKFSSGSSSQHSKKRPPSTPLPKVFSMLGNVDGVSYYCRDGELCEPHQEQEGVAPHSTYPRVRVVPMSNVSEKLAHALAQEIIKSLEFFVSSNKEPTPQQCNGFVVKFVVRSTDGSIGKRKFAFIEKEKEVQNYKDAIATFSSRYKGDIAQKKLQQMEEIFIYAGHWVLITKNLSPRASSMDIVVAGIIPTDLGVNEQSESVV